MVPFNIIVFVFTLLGLGAAFFVGLLFSYPAITLLGLPVGMGAGVAVSFYFGHKGPF